VVPRFEISRIAKVLKACGHGALCFYGAPGTDKTAWAQHEARAQDKPLTIKQAT
jgi:AAA+ superfamily predicted ATPase